MEQESSAKSNMEKDFMTSTIETGDSFNTSCETESTSSFTYQKSSLIEGENREKQKASLTSEEKSSSKGNASLTPDKNKDGKEASVKKSQLFPNIKDSRKPTEKQQVKSAPYSSSIHRHKETSFLQQNSAVTTIRDRSKSPRERQISPTFSAFQKESASSAFQTESARTSSRGPTETIFVYEEQSKNAPRTCRPKHSAQNSTSPVPRKTTVVSKNQGQVITTTIDKEYAMHHKEEKSSTIKTKKYRFIGPKGTTTIISSPEVVQSMVKSSGGKSESIQKQITTSLIHDTSSGTSTKTKSQVTPKRHSSPKSTSLQSTADERLDVQQRSETHSTYQQLLEDSRKRREQSKAFRALSTDVSEQEMLAETEVAIGMKECEKEFETIISFEDQIENINKKLSDSDIEERQQPVCILEKYTLTQRRRQSPSPDANAPRSDSPLRHRKQKTVRSKTSIKSGESRIQHNYDVMKSEVPHQNGKESPKTGKYEGPGFTRITCKNTQHYTITSTEDGEDSSNIQDSYLLYDSKIENGSMHHVSITITSDQSHLETKGLGENAFQRTRYSTFTKKKSDLNSKVPVQPTIIISPSYALDSPRDQILDKSYNWENGNKLYHRSRTPENRPRRLSPTHYQRESSKTGRHHSQERPRTPIKHRTHSYERDRSPGPGYVCLPTTIGINGHDTTRPKSPAFSMGGRYNKKIEQTTPGPGDYSIHDISRAGNQHVRGGIISGRFKEKSTFNTPAPGTYDYEGGIRSITTKKGTTITGRPKENTTYETPGPGSYRIEDSDNSQYTSKFAFLSGRHQEAHHYKTPGPASYRIEDSDPSQYTSKHAFISGRHTEPQQFQTPAPGAYSPEQNIKALNRAPAITISGRHTPPQPYQTPSPTAYSPERSDQLLNKSTEITIKGRLKEPEAFQTPAPGTYSLEESDKMLHSSTSVSISGRHKETTQFQTPAPGDYCPEKSVELLHKGPEITIKGRLKEPEAFQTPAPGTYSLEESDKMLHSSTSVSICGHDRETMPYGNLSLRSCFSTVSEMSSYGVRGDIDSTKLLNDVRNLHPEICSDDKYMIFCSCERNSSGAHSCGITESSFSETVVDPEGSGNLCLKSNVDQCGKRFDKKITSGHQNAASKFNISFPHALVEQENFEVSDSECGFSVLVPVLENERNEVAVSDCSVVRNVEDSLNDSNSSVCSGVRKGRKMKGNIRNSVFGFERTAGSGSIKEEIADFNSGGEFLENAKSHGHLCSHKECAGGSTCENLTEISNGTSASIVEFGDKSVSSTEGCDASSISMFSTVEDNSVGSISYTSQNVVKENGRCMKFEVVESASTSVDTSSTQNKPRTKQNDFRKKKSDLVLTKGTVPKDSSLGFKESSQSTEKSKKVVQKKGPKGELVTHTFEEEKVTRKESQVKTTRKYKTVKVLKK